jgi:hypothetical protein
MDLLIVLEEPANNVVVGQRDEPIKRDRNSARIEQQKGSGRFEPFGKEHTRKDGSRAPVLIGGATFEEGVIMVFPSFRGRVLETKTAGTFSTRQQPSRRLPV